MRLIIITILQIVSISLFAQGWDVKNKELTFSFGFAEYDIQKHPTSDNLDFINYAYSDPDILDYGLIKIGYKFGFLAKYSADIKLMMQSDLAPVNYDVSVSYHFNKMLGIGVGSMLTNTYIMDFEEYHYQAFPEYYLLDENSRQFKAYDLGFYISPFLSPIQNDKFRATIKCDIGLSSFLKEHTAFYHKRKLSNERLLYDYQTIMTFQPYVNPRLELRLQAFKVKTTSVGFLLNSNFFYSNRSMNYNQTTQQWNTENEQFNKMKLTKHNYSRFEMDFGLYVKW